MTTQNNKNDNPVGKPDEKTGKQKSDFERFIEDSLEVTDLLCDEDKDDERLTEVKSRNTEPAAGSVHFSTKKMAEIIYHNELIGHAKHELVRAILNKQIKMFERKTEILEHLDIEMTTLKKKQKVAVAALKRAKSVKLDNEIILLISNDLDNISNARQRCKEKMRVEKRDIKRIGLLINLLDSAI